MIKHPDTCVEKHSGEEGFRTLKDISKPINLGKQQKKDRKHERWVTPENTSKQLQDRNKCGMSTVLSMLVESLEDRITNSTFKEH